MKINKIRNPWNQPQQFANYGNKTTKTGFYQSKAWRDLRNEFIQENPLCAECERSGTVTEGKVVDHIIPIKKGGASLDKVNLQTLCVSCNARKTAKDK